jgi:AcrR family transcriptional regulator
MATPQPALRRREQHRAEARRAILDATERLLVDDGPEGFSMRRLVERCGYTAPTIYHYFGDKQRLLDELLEERLHGLVQRLRRVPLGDDPVENLRALALAFGRFGLRNPAHYALLMLPRDPALPPPPSEEKARAFFDEPMERLAEAGCLGTNPEVARQSLWAFLHGLIALRSSRPDVEWAKGLLETGIDALIRGLVRSREETS